MAKLSYILSRLVISLILFIAFLLFPEKRAYAYLDPGAGSYFYQMAIAGFISCIFAIKVFWSNIKGFIKRVFLRKKT